MSQLSIMHVVGARPNYMKIAPIMQAISAASACFKQVLVHTGQHYDYNMSQLFFEHLNLPDPNYHLQVGSGTHTTQTARIMLAFEEVVNEVKPNVVVVVGDVNSTLGCTLVCVKAGITTAHVEAGLRSFDRTMPEEINRVLTDQVADLLFTPSQDGNINLEREGVPAERIHFVGNVMIDSLVKSLPLAQQRPIRQELGLPSAYALVTLHRPANVDDQPKLIELLYTLQQLAVRLPIVFPMHPRTHRRLSEWQLEHLVKDHANLRIIEPLGYLDFLALMAGAAVVLTDSGGIQEETTYLGVPCVTVRPNTERPVTITEGTNRLVACQQPKIMAAVEAALQTNRNTCSVPELWDGAAAHRIVDVLRGLC